MKTAETQNKLDEIKTHFDKIKDIFNSFPEGMKDVIFKYHQADGSLNHCIRWGSMAAEELLNDAELITRMYNDNY